MTVSLPSSTSLTISATALRGMMTPGMPSEPVGAGSSTRASRCPSVATARSIVRAGDIDGVEIDAVEVVARLLGGDRELRLLDQALQVGADRVKRWGRSPAARSGKSLSGRACSMKRERPERICIWPASPVISSDTCAPSGSLRTMS